MRELPSPPGELVAPDVPLVSETSVSLCDVCGGAQSDPCAAGFDYELRTCRNRWTYVRCQSCGHVWLDPRPGVDALDTIYPATYYAYNYGDISAVARKGKEVLDGLKMRKILRLVGHTPRRYLDVGCGDGRYLTALHRRGVPLEGLSGLELDADVVADLRARGFDAYNERVETCDRFSAGTFDLITMFHVIEHVESPRAVVKRLAELLAPGGVLALETPNLDSLDGRLFAEGSWGGYHIPRHWHLFRPGTLRQLVESSGLEVEALRFETGHAFWMYSVHHRLRYGAHPHPRLARVFDPFESVLPLVAFTTFDKVRAAFGAKTSAMLIAARKPA